MGIIGAAVVCIVAVAFIAIGTHAAPSRTRRRRSGWAGDDTSAWTSDDSTWRHDASDGTALGGHQPGAHHGGCDTSSFGGGHHGGCDTSSFGDGGGHHHG